MPNLSSDSRSTSSTRSLRSAPRRDSSSTDSVLFRLEEEMARRWRDGTPLLVEDLLAREPSLRNNPQAVLQLILCERGLRAAQGENVSLAELQARFPEWREPLRTLIECQQLFDEVVEPALFPRVGETVGEFRLLEELGRGAHSRVFLAAQESLSDRPVVVKMVPPETFEHHCLARLQNTHIVPLYSAQIEPEGRWLMLCMPFFGSTSFADVLAKLHKVPLPQRTGQQILDILDRNEPGGLALSRRGPARKFLSRLSYVPAVCWIGACLADAVHDAHEHDLIHLDLKPSNVLLTVEGQPMLLDFHLAQPPLSPDGPPPAWLGGTSGYMSPEQEVALSEMRQGEPLTVAVDGRSDIFSLGAMLCEALGIEPIATALAEAPRRHPQVSRGLADILTRCLESEPARRYPNAAALAEDLRRHLNDQPLAGVPNRSLRERWSKWRRRHPGALTRRIVAALLLGVLGGIAFLVWQKSSIDSVDAGGLPGTTPASWHLVAPKPSEGWTQFRRGESLMREGSLVEAYAALTKASELSPDNGHFHFGRGVCAYRLERGQDAVDAFSRCIALSTGSDRAKAHVNRALAYGLLGQTRQAIADYDRACDLDPQLAAAVLNRGVLHFHEGRFAEALADLQAAARLDPDNEQIVFNLALVHHAMQESAAAARCVELVLRKNPGHEKAAALRAQLR